jgi:hypothetical protein
MPALQRFQHLAIGSEIDVGGDFGRVIDVHDVHGVAPYFSRVPDAMLREAVDRRAGTVAKAVFVRSGFCGA